MTTNWDLTPLYQGLEDPAYEGDIRSYKEMNAQLALQINDMQEAVTTARIENILTIMEEIHTLEHKLYTYLELRSAVNTEDGTILAQINRMESISADYARTGVAAEKYLGSLAMPEIWGRYRNLYHRGRRSSDRSRFDQRRFLETEPGYADGRN